MKRKNGFTLVELLAVIVVLGVILVIATTNVIKSINDSKTKAKYIAAKDIVEIAEAYFAVNNVDYVEVSLLKDEYLESDATNPKTGENDLFSQDDNINANNQCVRKGNYSSQNQNGYEPKDNKYYFDGYLYNLNDNCCTDNNCE